MPYNRKKWSAAPDAIQSSSLSSLSSSSKQQQPLISQPWI
jgi:hypothetical protein